MDADPQRRKSSAFPRRFGLRACFAIVTLFAVAAAILGVAIRQNRSRHDAWFGLSRIGLQSSIASGDGRSLVSFRYAKPAFPDSDLEPAVDYLHAIGRRRDLGFSAGDQIVLIDFTNCQVSDRVIAKMQAHFPDADIRR